MHIEFLLEEESAGEALSNVVPKIVGGQVSFSTHIFQGKRDLLNALPARLRGYAKWLPSDWRIVVLVDRDNDDCHALKAKMGKMVKEAGLISRTATSGKGVFHVLNRIAIEELEAWFFGDVEALVSAYRGVSPTLAKKRGFKDSDAITGGTWEKLERILKNAGYYRAGMPKIEVARSISSHMVPDRNRSRSFRTFCQGLRELIA